MYLQVQVPMIILIHYKALHSVLKIYLENLYVLQLLFSSVIHYIVHCMGGSKGTTVL